MEKKKQLYNQQFTKKVYSGFSLVEMLIVVTIVAILIGIAYPNYSKQIQSSRRTEARTSLLDYAMKFEEYYGNNYTYTNAETYYNLDSNPQTENGFYRLSASVPSGGASYTITATAIGNQANDTTCSTITINNIGQKSPSACW